VAGAHPLEDPALALLVVVGVAHQDHEALGGQCVFNAPDDWGEKGVVEIRDQNPDRVGPSGLETAGCGIGSKLQLAGSLKYPFCGLTLDQVAAF
jgi:hypothetical protein